MFLIFHTPALIKAGIAEWRRVTINPAGEGVLKDDLAMSTRLGGLRKARRQQGGEDDDGVCPPAGGGARWLGEGEVARGGDSGGVRGVRTHNFLLDGISKGDLNF